MGLFEKAVKIATYNPLREVPYVGDVLGPASDVASVVTPVGLPKLITTPRSLYNVGNPLAGFLFGSSDPTEDTMTALEEQLAASDLTPGQVTNYMIGQQLSQQAMDAYTTYQKNPTIENAEAYQQAQTEIVNWQANFDANEQLATASTLPDPDDFDSVDDWIAATTKQITQTQKTLEEEEIDPDQERLLDLQQQSLELDVETKKIQLEAMRQEQQMAGITNLLGFLDSDTRMAVFAAMLEMPMFRQSFLSVAPPTGASVRESLGQTGTQITRPDTIGGGE